MPQRLNSYFATSRELRGLTHQAQQLAALQKRYRQIAPPPLARASQVIGFERHILTLGAENSAIAAKLRQLAPQFVHSFQESGLKVTGIRVRVQVTAAAPRRPPQRPALSVAARQDVAALAAKLPDSPLKNALQRLARRH